MKATTSRTFLLEPDDGQKLAELCGQFNENLKLIERHLELEIFSRGNAFRVNGNKEQVEHAEKLIKKLYLSCFKANKEYLNPEKIHLTLQENFSQTSYREPKVPMTDQSQEFKPDQETQTAHGYAIETPRKRIETRGDNQCAYIQKISKYDINFGIGPAGTGKTYLAVAAAVAALKQEEVHRIVLVRPAVEAGEKLGFLPGDLNEKVNPYLRPLYDALYEMLGFETVDKMLEKQIIEIAPLAYMRGRTLNNAFIILDESQNTTREQMKMFLTRIGFGAKAVITGDVTQIDLPKGSESGLIHATQVLKNVKEIGFTHFTAKDVVRHKLVQKIIMAYSEHEKQSTIESIAKRNDQSKNKNA